jgi:hypothetical protein
VWIAVDVQRHGCLWVAIYYAYTITFRTSRTTGRTRTTIAPEPRPPNTRTQVVPGCKESATSMRADTFPRVTGGTVRVAGYFVEAPKEAIAVVVKNREGLVLAREKAMSSADGRFAIAFDVEAVLSPEGEELMLEAIAKEGALRSETKVRLVPPRGVPIVVWKLPSE